MNSPSQFFCRAMRLTTWEIAECVRKTALTETRNVPREFEEDIMTFGRAMSALFKDSLATLENKHDDTVDY